MGFQKIKNVLNKQKVKKTIKNTNVFKCKYIRYEQSLDKWHCDINQRYMPDSDLNECECLCYNGVHSCDCHSMKRPEHKNTECTD